PRDILSFPTRRSSDLENIVERVEKLGASKLSKLKQLIDHENVGEVRQAGFLLGLEMVTDKNYKTPLDDAGMTKIVGACKQKGLIIGRNGDTVPDQNNVIIVAPPLTSREEDLDFVVETVQSVIRSL